MGRAPRHAPELGEVPRNELLRKRYSRPEAREPTLIQAGYHLAQGRFRLMRPLGEGGMGKVWLATHLGLGRDVALKVLHRTVHAVDDHRKRFEREAQALGRLVHPGIVQALDFGTMEDGRHFLAMEYVDGETLSTRLEGGRTVSWQQALALITPVVDALAYAHGQGVLHRDLKPDNLMIDRATGQVLILDLGLARIAQPLDGDSSLFGLTDAKMALGTPAYSAPEQLRGELMDERADLYGVGAILFRLVAGTPPYPGQGLAEVVAGQRSGPPPELAQVAPDRSRPKAFDRLVRELLQNDPARRPASAARVAERLRKLSAPRTARWWPALVGGAITAAAAVAASVAYFLS
jgi:serine/threonine protein kinase